ncbi:amidohydrolase family protein [Pseudofrankia inefficax]|uniref:Amidohydrolase 2 n=1 Tax=Pseudofrankia inefficax (strain DSM 45817 / CECT 9037 / DDB 130130 / EuI1c) TaxID=298654 RepID=E3IUK0_PSEI1|nr:amidohydrolase family protein [Pseudofrankia inefficax]ADP83685.1 amidohydrolase 2 [Pseudofrankia inefficax]
MKIIALEEHTFPRDILSAAGLDLGSRAGRKAAELDDLGEGRLKTMDAAGVDVQVLSALAHIVQQLEPASSVAVSQALNDRMAATVQAHPERFRAFATLPISAPEQAVAELRRAVDELGFVGTMIHGQTNGVFLDHPSMEPVLACAERLGVPIYLHPAPPPPAVQDAYYSGLPADLAAALSTAGWGWHAECGLHVLRMIVAGVFERHPALEVIVGHMGEGLPFSLARADDMLSPLLKGQTPVAETAQRNLYITTSAYTTVAPLQCALTVLGADRILFSVDHPFADSAQGTAFLLSAPLSPADREKIAHGNAERVLGL